MAAPVSIGEIIDIINKASEIYKKIKDQPDQMVKIGKRMPRLKDFLEELAELLDNKKHPGSLASLRPKQTKRLNELMKDVKEDADQVFALLKRWEKNEGPAGLTWRFDWVAHVVYTLGSSPDKLDELYESIERHLNDITRFLVLLGAFVDNQAMQAGKTRQAVGAGQDKNTKQQLGVTPARKKPSPSPEPPITKKKMNYNICFVDSFNVGRSRVAEAYLKLVREWTIRTGGEWRVNNVHSAGLSVKRPNGCDAEIKALADKMVDRAKAVNTVGMDSLFDNKLFNYPYKPEVRAAVQRRSTIGIPRDFFSKYDFIVTFTLAQQIKVYKLREALIKADPKNRTHGKGKIVLLSEYKKAGQQIYEPEPGTDREKWNKTTSSIKIACKAFLKKEFDWKQPAPARS